MHLKPALFHKRVRNDRNQNMFHLYCSNYSPYGRQFAGVCASTRTWVSGVGDDANPCSGTAPCKTFVGAISKTSTGGQIDALDPGGYGAVTIIKSITIDGGGTMASALFQGRMGSSSTLALGCGCLEKRPGIWSRNRTGWDEIPERRLSDPSFIFLTTSGVNGKIACPLPRADL